MVPVKHNVLTSTESVHCKKKPKHRYIIVAQCFRGDCNQDTTFHDLLHFLARRKSPELTESVKRGSSSIDSFFMHPEAYGQSTSSTCVTPECPILFGKGLFNWGTFEDHCFYLCDSVTFMKLEKLLDFLNVTQKGVASPYLYFWRGHYKLVWEVTEQKTNCFDEIPGSSCRLWFVLMAQHMVVFELFVSQFLDLNFKHWNSLNLLGHSSAVTEMPRRQFKVLECSMIFCDANDFVGLCPSSSISFSSILHNLRCIVHEVRIVKDFNSSECLCVLGHDSDGDKNVTNEENLPSASNVVPSDELQLFSEIELGEYSIKQETEDEEKLIEGNLHETIADLPCKRLYNKVRNTKLSAHLCSRSKSSCNRQQECTCVGHQLLQCPECSFALKGGEDRVERLLQHVRKTHRHRSRFLTQYIRKLYPFKPCPLNPLNASPSRQSKVASHCALIKSSEDF